MGLIIGMVAFFAEASVARFEDVTKAAGVGNMLYGTGLAWGDYDEDGNLDLYVCNWGGGGANNA
ncbi:MAG: hypothetical protein DRP97_04645, partial [Candidatus Latescibacterota bacterium]